MKAKKELKRTSKNFVEYCNKYSFNISAIKADIKNGKTKIFRFRTRTVYGDMYKILGDVHCTISKKERPMRKTCRELLHSNI